MTILYYIHDPMCSWCWGFRPAWLEIQQNLPKNISLQYLLGGLAPDSNVPMPQTMQNDIASYWRKIQQHIPNTPFNFDFWEQCEPRRSTYPACRAVIATRNQQLELEQEMIKAIQQVYYLQAKNPSDDETLINLAITLGLDKQQFRADLNASKTQAELIKEINFCQQIGARGFPSLVLKKQGQFIYIPVNYNDPAAVLKNITNVLSF